MTPRPTGAMEVAVPTNPSRALRETARAWEAFVATGEFAGAPPRPAIALSWQRSRALGIDPFMERAPTLLEPEPIEAALRRDDFGRAGKEVLDSFAQVVVGTGHVIVLANADGTLLYSVGHRGVERVLEQINFVAGAGWSESTVGPNGEGSPIALGRPEMIFGTEHYCQRWQPWVCYGCPVREPETGTILGAVDISGPAKQVQVHTFALTISIAQCIEQLLAVFQLQRREALLTLSRGLERRWSGEAILVVTESGRVADLNAAAASALGMQPAALQNALLADVQPALWAPVKASVASGRAREERVTLKTASGAEKPALYRVEPIARQGEHLGSVVILHDAVPATAPHRSSAHRSNPGKASAKYTFADILGSSVALRAATELARAAARGSPRNPVLLIGESGTGKELVAHAIHAEGLRGHGPFIAVHCGALPRELVESELFGYAPGSFTGARREGQEGKFEAADSGTIFLDEIDTMPLELQGKLLRVLEAWEVVRVGSVAPVPVDVRIVAACSVDLRQRVAQEQFRLDLYHRLTVIEIRLPSLRERLEDLPQLAEALLHRECAAAGRPALVLSPEAIERLGGYAWPGNVRELRNLCAQWALVVEGSVVQLAHVPAHVREALPDAPAGLVPDGGLRELHDRLIRRVLAETGGDVAETARRLGVARTTIYRRLKRLISTT